MFLVIVRSAMAGPIVPLDVVFSFDTTGSMVGCLDEVRRHVSDMIQRLKTDIPDIRVAIFAHGDYCDRNNYVTKYVDFTDDVKKLCDFTRSVVGTGGGDCDECYELVLYKVRHELSWRAGSLRALVMIGDASPHEPDYPGNFYRLDWRKEAEALAHAGVRIYGVKCGEYLSSEAFYREISDVSCGHYLELVDFKLLPDFLMAVCYKQQNPELLDKFEDEVRSRPGPVHADLDKMFKNLRSELSVKLGRTKVPSRTEPVYETPKWKVTKRSYGSPFKAPPETLKDPNVKPKKQTEDLRRYKLENIPRRKREDITDSYFQLSSLTWSDWQLVISPVGKGQCSHPRAGTKTGYRAKQLLIGSITGDKPALYEVAVKPRARCRKVVVYSKCMRTSFNGRGNWERFLFGTKRVAAQIDAVVGKGCEVYARRAELKKLGQGEEVEVTLDRYDYAWSVVRPDRTTHRPLTKAGVEISEAMDV